MRLIAGISIALACAACSPLRDAEGCPKPCPTQCPDSCLPTGYCAEETYTLETAEAVYTLTQAFGNLPPDAALALSMHAVVDLADRGNNLPWDYWIQIKRDYSTVLVDVSAFNTDAFPVVLDWTGNDAADSEGVFNLALLFDCRDREGNGAGCLILPGTRLSVQLVDATPWEDPPACK